MQRAAGLFDELVVAVYDLPAKSLLFSPEERKDLVRASIAESVAGCRITVEGFSSLTVQYARARGAQAIVRGLRAVTDFEYEYKMTMMNRHLEPDVETILLMTSQRLAHIHSSLVKEVAAGGAAIDGLVPAAVAEALASRFSRARP